VATDTGAPAPGLAPGDEGPVWHTLSADAVLSAEKVDEHSGLSSAEVASRAARFGPNKFDAGTAEPRWRAFLRQYADLMQIVLLVAGLVSLALQEWETGIVLIVLTLFNAVLGLQQEGKAAVAVAALTGESLPVAKGTEPIEGADTPLGDRSDMVYMNTNATRGSGRSGPSELGKLRKVMVHRPRVGRDRGSGADGGAAAGRGAQAGQVRRY
jgi:magnesium-transporting ATPase (P-type)